MFINAVQAATEAVAEQGPTGFAALGFDGKALLFQVINFTLLLVILRFVAYKPILKLLDNRRQRIEESLRASKEMETMKETWTKQQQEMMQTAQTKVDEAISQGRTQATDIIKTAEVKAALRAEKIVEKAQEKAVQDLAKVKAELKNETVELVARATEKMISTKLDKASDQALIIKTLEAVENQPEV